MEGKGKEFRPTDLEDRQFLWAIYKTSVPRVLATSFLGLARYCADQLPKRMTLGYLRILAAILVIVMPRTLTHLLLYPIFRLVFGNLYPAYASYKAVRTKNVKEYVKWMMYWIVFALFTCAETFTDVFFSFWFPFYYEIKTILVVWLLSPATNGSSILYRRFVHPALTRREAEIDEALARATEQGYTAVLHLGSKGVNYATTVLMQTAIKHLLRPEQILGSHEPLVAIQSTSAISSSAKPPATSMPKTDRTTTEQVDSVAATSRRSLPPLSTSSDELIPVEPVPSMHEEVDTHDDDDDDSITAEIYRMIQEQPFKVPSPKKTRKTRKTKKEQTNPPGVTRVMRSSTRRIEYEFSDDDFEIQAAYS